MEYQPLHLAVENRDLKMMRLLLDHGAPVDGVFGCDGGSETALHYACSLGHVEMIKLLLEHGANLEDGGHYGTALGFAVHYRNLDAVRYLLDRGADATGLRAPTTPICSILRWVCGIRVCGVRHGCQRSGKEITMETIRTHLTPLAKEVQHSADEFLRIIAGMFKEAEDAVADIENSLLNMATASDSSK
ncbi:ankyrin repeat-containing domain protein [Mycena metata]|uniref:Ankyrin repeat-containing domain protein n=1 Tax=Mycena metata TaxID=1033252 RepID=A0AAD7NB61_9AGAR|nr:ankyrin repeat-containing domain protein [Mycena metata]